MARNDRERFNREPKDDLIKKTVAVNRVTKVVKGGRNMRFAALVVVGDGKGRVGAGTGKAAEVPEAIEKATNIAKKNLVTIPLVNETISHDIEVKYGAARVMLKPAAPGTGIIAGGVVRAIIGTTGISNLVTKSLGSTNKVTIAYATIKALSQLKPREEWVGFKSKAAAKEDK